jgi:hypothetical protein
MTPAKAGGNAGLIPDFVLRAHPGYCFAALAMTQQRAGNHTPTAFCLQTKQ